jgi:hypothetical protein
MAFATPCERARAMQKSGTNYKGENCQAGPIQISTSVRMSQLEHPVGTPSWNTTPRHEFYSLKRAENSLHLRRIIIDADSCFGVSRMPKSPFLRVLEIRICLILWFLQKMLVAEPWIKMSAVCTYSGLRTRLRGIYRVPCIEPAGQSNLECG